MTPNQIQKAGDVKIQDELPDTLDYRRGSIKGEPGSRIMILPRTVIRFDKDIQEQRYADISMGSVVE